MAINFNDKDAVLQELADTIKADVEDLKITESGYEFYRVEYGDEEYLIFKDEDSAIYEAEERVKEMIDVEGWSIFNQNFVENYVEVDETSVSEFIEDLISSELEDLKYDKSAKERAKENFIEWWVQENYNDLDLRRQFEEDLRGEYGDDEEEFLKLKQDSKQMEELWQEYLEYMAEGEWDSKAEDDWLHEEENNLRERYESELEKDPIGFLEDYTGMDIYELLDAGYLYVNEKKFVEEAVRIDGWGHFLADYDGEERYTKNGLPYCRVN